MMSINRTIIGKFAPGKMKGDDMNITDAERGSAITQDETSPA